MSRLEDFLSRSKQEQARTVTDMMEYSSNKYQCQTCDEWSNGSFFDSKTMTIYWDCPSGHQSKVALNV